MFKIARAKQMHETFSNFHNVFSIYEISYQFPLSRTSNPHFKLLLIAKGPVLAETEMKGKELNFSLCFSQLSSTSMRDIKTSPNEDKNGL